MHLELCDDGDTAIPTRRPEQLRIAVIVGLPDWRHRACARALDETIQIVGAPDVAEACYLLSVLRPGLVVATSALSDAEGARLTAAAAASKAQLVCIGPTASGAAIAWLLQRSAAVAYGTAFHAPHARALLDSSSHDQGDT